MHQRLFNRVGGFLYQVGFRINRPAIAVVLFGVEPLPFLLALLHGFQSKVEVRASRVSRAVSVSDHLSDPYLLP